MRRATLFWTVAVVIALSLPGFPKRGSVASLPSTARLVAEIPFLPDDFGDRYAIERELGHGATATVYLASDLRFDERPVAIKVLSEHFALPVPRERFLREIQTTAKLNHPHIVTLLEAGTTRGTLQRPFYVMRFIDGETLRDVIARGPLPVAEALRIARQVASALGHAHRHAVIHRDIKPGNIMIEDGHTWVTDFGIARAMARKDNDSVTSTGVTIGTPAYMSPEQAMGRGDLDVRSDIYSLGCVLYEMLAGRMPFDGPDVQVILNKHLAEPPPPIDKFRNDVPERVSDLLEIALAKKPEQRFATAADFAEALSLEGGGTLTPTRTQPARPATDRRIRSLKMSGIGVAVVGGVVLAWSLGLGRAALNPAAYFIAPFSRAAGVPSAFDPGRLFQDALNNWSDLQVLGRFDAPANVEDLDGPALRRVARGQRAGHYVRGEVAPVGDSIRVRAALYSTEDGSLERERAITLRATLSDADSLIGVLTDRVVFDDSVVRTNGGRAGTRSVTARRSFARGLEEVQRWELVQADSAFNQAAHNDPSYAQAHLWLAQVRSWQDTTLATWKSSADLAASGRLNLSAKDRSVSDALFALAKGNRAEACAEWDRLTQQFTFDFAAWYGLASCMMNDKAVVRDARSPSGWRFRSSYHHMLEAYEQAFQKLPAIHKSLRTGGYATVRDLLRTGGTSFLRAGRALDDSTMRFVAPAVWLGDSLALIPYLPEELGKSRSLMTRKRTSAGFERQRAVFLNIAIAWRSAFPQSPGALEAVAISLEMLGKPDALDTLRRARALEGDAHERLRLAVTEVWLQLKFSIPSDGSSVVAAKQLADSLLGAAQPSTPAEARMLSSLAAVLGRARLAASLARQGGAASGAPGPLERTAPVLQVYAAFAGPIDSLDVLEQLVSATIENLVAESDRERTRLTWLARPATLAFPDHPFRTISTIAAGGDDLLDIQRSYARGDTGAVRAYKARRAEVRARYEPADLTIDGLYPEARLFESIGDHRGAIAWLDPTLNALAGTAPQIFMDPVRAASLTRAMVFRAELADRLGDRLTAAKWARLVVTLWSGADEFLQPTLRHVEQLAQ